MMNGWPSHVGAEQAASSAAVLASLAGAARVNSNPNPHPALNASTANLMESALTLSQHNFCHACMETLRSGLGGQQKEQQKQQQQHPSSHVGGVGEAAAGDAAPLGLQVRALSLNGNGVGNGVANGNGHGDDGLHQPPHSLRNLAAGNGTANGALDEGEDLVTDSSCHSFSHEHDLEVRGSRTWAVVVAVWVGLGGPGVTSEMERAAKLEPMPSSTPGSGPIPWTMKKGTCNVCTGAICLCY